MKRILLQGSAVLFFLLAILSCAKHAEQDDLAQGQKCLDGVDQSNPASASDCLQYVQPYSSQQANILKCAIYMTSGGLVENRIVKAYQAMKDNSYSNKEAAFMAILSLNVPDVNSGYTKAQSANTYCQQTGIAGLQYLGNIILIGTYTAKVVAAISGGTGLDINNPTASNAALNGMLANCAQPPPATPDPSCTQDLTTVGGAVSTLGQSYCANPANASSSVCTKITGALAAGGGTSANSGQALFCILYNKTYNASTGQCNP